MGGHRAVTDDEDEGGIRRLALGGGGFPPTLPTTHREQAVPPRFPPRPVTTGKGGWWRFGDSVEHGLDLSANRWRRRVEERDRRNLTRRIVGGGAAGSSGSARGA